MRAAYLLDTNILSELARDVPDGRLGVRVAEHGREIATAAPVWHELLFGCASMPRGKRRTAIERYFAALVRGLVPILPYDTAAAEWHAVERARLVAKGRTPAFVDGQIAAIAVVNGLALVTRNVKDFRAFSGLRVEDWTR